MEPIIICYGCRKRVTRQEIRAGAHDHVDQEERERIQAQQAHLASGD